MTRFTAVLLASVCTLTAGAPPAAAQAVHELQISVPGGPSARVRVAEGAVTTFEHAGRKLGFTVRAGGSTGILIEVRQLAAHSTATYSRVSQVLELPGSMPATTYHEWTVALQSSGGESGGEDGSLFGESCCVTCGETTACACAVVHSCGKCCIGECCEIVRAPWERDVELASLGAVWSRAMYQRPCPGQRSLRAALSFVPARRG